MAAPSAVYAIELEYGTLLYGVCPVCDFVVIKRTVNGVDEFLTNDSDLPVWSLVEPVADSGWWKLKDNGLYPDVDVPFVLYLEYEPVNGSTYYMASDTTGTFSDWVVATVLSGGGFGSATRVHLASHVSRATRTHRMDG